MVVGSSPVAVTKFFYIFYHHSSTMKRSFFLSFYKMTHDPLSDHSKKKAALEPGVKDSAVRCDRNLDWQLIWQKSWLFEVEGEWILCGT